MKASISVRGMSQSFGPTLTPCRRPSRNLRLRVIGDTPHSAAAGLTRSICASRVVMILVVFHESWLILLAMTKTRIQGDTCWTRQRVRIVRDLMMQLNVSQSELARRLKDKGISVSQKAISLILSHGIKNPRKPSLPQVARVLGVPLDILRYAGGQASDVEAVINGMLALPKREAVFDEAAFDQRLEEARWRLTLTPFIYCAPAPDGTMQPVKTTFMHAIALFSVCDSPRDCAGFIAQEARSTADEIARAYAVVRFYDPDDGDGVNERLQLLAAKNEKEASAICGLVDQAKNEMRDIATKLHQMEQ